MQKVSSTSIKKTSKIPKPSSFLTYLNKPLFPNLSTPSSFLNISPPCSLLCTYIPYKLKVFSIGGHNFLLLSSSFFLDSDRKTIRRSQEQGEILKMNDP
ncbi:hypothetical protein NC652_029097 [Populus alba x Populus x berolinensis]|nr:hypothetical protein NC652_029097 [Populus alba x Populus x berolinensis]